MTKKPQQNALIDLFITYRATKHKDKKNVSLAKKIKGTKDGGLY